MFLCAAATLAAMYVALRALGGGGRRCRCARLLRGGAAPARLGRAQPFDELPTAIAVASLAACSAAATGSAARGSGLARS